MASLQQAKCLMLLSLGFSLLFGSCYATGGVASTTDAPATTTEFDYKKYYMDKYAGGGDAKGNSSSFDYKKYYMDKYGAGGGDYKKYYAKYMPKSHTKEANKRKIIIILGAPCAGCGTQSPNIINALNIPHLDTGNMLRQASESGTAAGITAGKMMKEGVLVTDEIVNQVVSDRIKQPDCAKGFLLDGYPRNVAQSKQLDTILAATGEAVTDVLVLNVPMAGLQQCVMHRWTSDSGDEWTSDYLAFRVPKSLKIAPEGTTPQCALDDLKNCNMWDDWTHEPLLRRADDNLNTLAERYKIYKAQTYPVLDHYTTANVIRNVDGYQPEPKVWADIEKALGLPPSAGLVAKYQHRATEAITPMGAFALLASGAIAIAVAVITRPRKGEMSEPLLVE